MTYDGADGPVTKSIFMDAYHYDTPKVPAGFTCAAPLASVAPIPPADPAVSGPAMLGLAVEQGTSPDVAPIPLDVSTPRGYLFDQFGSIALRARAAATAGTPLDAMNPSKDLQSNGLTVLANPMTCGDRTIAPVSVELNTAHAVQALAKWRVEPIRINGAGVASPNVVQVPFRP